jgi:hypothetical protein
MAPYTLEQKIEALKRLDEQGDLAAVSREKKISVETLRQWRREAEAIRAEQRRRHQASTELTMSKVSEKLAETSLKIVEAMQKPDVIDKAPLNQLAAALGVLVDRYMKLAGETTEHGEQVVRIEYVYPNGTIADAPPWAGSNPEVERPLPGGGVRQALRQDRTGENAPDRQRHPARHANVVARAHVSDGEPGLAGFEDDDGERLRYDD